MSNLKHEGPYISPPQLVISALGTVIYSSLGLYASILQRDVCRWILDNMWPCNCYGFLVQNCTFWLLFYICVHGGRGCHVRYSCCTKLEAPTRTVEIWCSHVGDKVKRTIYVKGRSLTLLLHICAGSSWCSWQSKSWLWPELWLIKSWLQKW